MITAREKPAESPQNSMISAVYYPEYTLKTANSAGSGPVFVRISGFGDNPVKYTDPDGRSPIWDTAASTSPVGVSDPPAPRSLYSMQFNTEAGRQEAFSKMLGGIAAIVGAVFIRKPIVGKVAAGVAVVAEAGQEKTDPRIILYTERKAFIEGARAELNKLDALLTSVDGDASDDYAMFLQEQKGLLTNELNININYDAQEEKRIKSDIGKYASRYTYEDTRDSHMYSSINYNSVYNDQ
jgi:hypothetical protein